MTVKIMISIPDHLKRMVEDYNNRHPFEKLNISQISQKAIHEKIRAEDPDLINQNSIKVPKDKHELKTEAKRLGDILLLPEETSVIPKDQPKPGKKALRALKKVAPSLTEGKEINCKYCNTPFTAKNQKALFCSDKCRMGSHRKEKK